MRYICISCVLFSFQVLEGDPGGAEEEQEAAEEEEEEQGAAGVDRLGRQRDFIAGRGGERCRTGTRFKSLALISNPVLSNSFYGFG